MLKKVVCVLLGNRLRHYAGLYLALMVTTLLLFCRLQYLTSHVRTPLTPMTRSKNDSYKEQSNFLPTLEPFSLDALRYSLEKFADVNKTIFITLVDNAYVDVALNLYLTSFKRLAIENYLFIAMNAKCCDVLNSRGINCLHYIPEYSHGQNASVYNSGAFNIKTNLKAKPVLDSLKLGFSPFLIDLDVVFISNPLDIVLPLADKHDLIVQDNRNHNLNSGFYFGKSTPKLIEYFTQCYNVSLTPLAAKDDDQVHMQAILKRSSLNVHYLDKRQFSVGSVYWDQHRLSFNYEHPWMKNAGGTKTRSANVIVHNNWVVTKEAKVYRFKESLMWLVDNDGYYSNSSEKYIVFDNPHMSKSENGLQLEAQALLNALSIGYLLNRKVILPAFHCHKIRNKICENNAQECSLMALYHVATFDAHFGGDYREHVFLSHDLVPDDVRASKTAPFAIETTGFSSLKRASNDVSEVRTLTPRNVTIGATPREIRMWFSREKDSVLVFRNMYGGVFAGFGKSAEFAGIKRRLKQALKPCNYRQTSNCKGSPKSYF